jgi:hypothetical protein
MVSTDQEAEFDGCLLEWVGSLRIVYPRQVFSTLDPSRLATLDVIAGHCD